MARRKDHIVHSEDYQRYLENKMTPKERHDFEKSLLNDEFENESIEGLSQLSPQEFSADLHSLRDRLTTRTKNRSLFMYWRMAAALILLGVFSFLVYYLLESNTTREVAQQKDIPSIEKSGAEENIDSSVQIEVNEDSNNIIAYQQELPVIEESQKKSKAKEEPSSSGNEIESRDEVLLEIVDNELESAGINLDLEQDEVIVLPSLAQAEDEELPIEEDYSARKKEIQSAKAFAPAAVMSKSAPSERARLAANSENARTITGSVMSAEDDEAVPGVNIIVQGSQIGTVSDIEGKYSITVRIDTTATLVFAYVGFLSEEIVVNDQEEINVKIEPEISALSEIVVVGYGTANDNQEPESSYTPPLPVGGNARFKNYVKENIRYPASGLEDKIKGTVKLKFTIDADGLILNIKVLKSLGDDFDKEAIRLVKEGPNWEPAKESDSPVEREVNMKIRFRPPE